jgi:hypothetical protein
VAGLDLQHPTQVQQRLAAPLEAIGEQARELDPDRHFRRPGQLRELGLEQARVEAYNVTNTPHFNNPNGNVNSSGFMTITSTSTNSRNRQMRLGARLSF